jgi:GH24 family phage-related lysozyme (muramidase)
MSEVEDKDLLDETKKISELNKKILDKLIRIEKDLIDEQDTSIKGSQKKKDDSKNKVGFNNQTLNVSSMDGFGLLGSILGPLLGLLGMGYLTNKLKGAIDKILDKDNKTSKKLDDSEKKLKDLDDKSKKLDDERKNLEDKIKTADETKKAELDKKLQEIKDEQQKIKDEQTKINEEVKNNSSDRDKKITDPNEKPWWKTAATNVMKSAEEIAEGVTLASTVSTAKNVGITALNAAGKLFFVGDVANNMYNDAGDYDTRYKEQDYAGMGLNAVDNVVETIDPTPLLRMIPEIAGFSIDNWMTETLGGEKERGFLSTGSKKLLDLYDGSFNQDFKDKLKKTDTNIFEGAEKLYNYNKKVNTDTDKVKDFEKMGVLDSSFFGKSDIKDWAKVHKLSTPDLLTLSMNDSINLTDRDAIKGIIEQRMKFQIAIPDNTYKLNSQNEVKFSDTEVLAYDLFNAKNEFEKFVVDHPFTDENSEKTKKTENGKTWEEIKFKDEELNEEYVKLKEKYDYEYGRFLELRKTQIKALNNYKEINGEVLTNKEFNNYSANKNNYSSVSQYVQETRTAEANKSVEDLISKYKNIALPPDSIELAERIKGSEGFRATAYPDNGHMSIGYGHQIKPGEEYLLTKTISKEEANKIFANDFDIYSKAAEKIPGFNEAPKIAKDVLIDMTYNMGPAWYKKWDNFTKFISNKEYSKAADIIRHSLYAKQVQGRAFQNAKRLDIADGIAKNTIQTPSKQSEVQSISTASVTEPSKEINNKKDNSTQLDNKSAEESKGNNVAQVEAQTKNLTENTKVVLNANYVNSNVNVSNNIAVAAQQEDKSEDVSLNDTFILKG